MDIQVKELLAFAQDPTAIASMTLNSITIVLFKLQGVL
jgi:hypothetical protein